jgi:hypothetical protein
MESIGIGQPDFADLILAGNGQATLPFEADRQHLVLQAARRDARDAFSRRIIGVSPKIISRTGAARLRRAHATDHVHNDPGQVSSNHPVRIASFQAYRVRSSTSRARLILVAR